MTIYIFIIIACILFLLFGSLRPEKNNKKIFIFSSILVVISGFRSIGTDVINYKNYFDYIDVYSLDNSLYEKGYYLLNKLIHTIFGDFQFVLIFTSLFVVLVISKTILSLSVKPMLSLFFFVTFYFYFTSFNLIRQYIAMAIVFASVKFILRKQAYIFILLIFISSLFHTTSLFFIPFYWIVRRKIPDIFYWIIFIFSLVFSVFTPILISIISVIFPRLSYYSNYSLEGASANFSILLTLMTFIMAKILYKKLIKIDENAYVYINLVFFAMCFSILSRNNIMFFRISSYFYLFIILLLPIIFQALTKKWRFLFIFYMIPFSICYMFYLIKNNNAGVFPYDFSIFSSSEIGIYFFITGIWLILSFFIFFRRKKDHFEKR